MKLLGKRPEIAILELEQQELLILLSGLNETIEVWDAEYESRTGVSKEDFKVMRSSLRDVVDEVLGD